MLSYCHLPLSPLLLLAALSCGSGCGDRSHLSPRWTTTSVELGAGQLHLGVRSRWVGLRDTGGAAIQTPDGGRVAVRIFNCPRPSRAVKALLQERLRSRLLTSEFIERGRVFAWRWHAGSSQPTAHWSAATRHGPLLLVFTSSTISMDDLVEIATRARLDVPVPSIPGCYPVCTDEARCRPQSTEDL